MNKQISLVKRDGEEVTGNLRPFGGYWNFNFLSRGSQINLKLEELIVPDEIIKFDASVSFFIDTILQFIEQSNMYNENSLGVEAGFVIRDAIVTSEFSPSDVKDKLKYRKILSGNLEASGWVVELVDGSLPFGLELKYEDGDYIIEGNVQTTPAGDYYRVENKTSTELTKFMQRQIQFVYIDYVDGLNSNTIVTEPPNTLEVGDIVQFPVSGDTRSIEELDHNDNFTVDEFVGDGSSGSLEYEYGRWTPVLDGNYTSIDTTWKGWLTVPSKDIFLRYSRMIYVFPEELLSDHTYTQTFTLGIRKDTNTEYHDLRTFNLNIRSNIDMTRDVQLVKEGGRSNLIRQKDFDGLQNQQTYVYGTGIDFSDPFDQSLHFVKTDNTRDDIEILNGKLDFYGTDPDNKLPIDNEEIEFYKNESGIRHQDNIGVSTV